MLASTIISLSLDELLIIVTEVCRATARRMRRNLMIRTPEEIEACKEKIRSSRPRSLMEGPQKAWFKSRTEGSLDRCTSKNGDMKIPGQGKPSCRSPHPASTAARNTCQSKPLVVPPNRRSNL